MNVTANLPVTDFTVGNLSRTLAGAAQFITGVRLVTCVSHAGRRLGDEARGPVGRGHSPITYNGSLNNNVFLGTTWEDSARRERRTRIRTDRCQDVEAHR